jgi:hypothetical protein
MIQTIFKFFKRRGQYYMVHKYMRQPCTLSLSLLYHRILSPMNRPLDKLNKSNRFSLCHRFHNYLSILHVIVRWWVFRMEYEQKIIINFSGMREPMLMKLYRDFTHCFIKRLMHVELSNSGLASYATAVKTFTILFVSEDFLWMISMQNLASLDKTPFELAQSITKTLLIDHTIVLRHLH